MVVHELESGIEADRERGFPRLSKGRGTSRGFPQHLAKGLCDFRGPVVAPLGHAADMQLHILRPTRKSQPREVDEIVREIVASDRPASRLVCYHVHSVQCCVG